MRSEYGGGTCQVSLPESVSEAVTVSAWLLRLAGRRGRILIVDDEDLIIRVLTRILGRITT